ncbi:hypothetical protein NEHOM01_1279 [Nematocida homosporus]|uniref:uncharacterized protein n=1 Tax=Nematocida homosporus TaxID=1912981 RepID=UPI00221EDC23|nr:uncharacterized protein NEHOM01_1279 [Nematocida homosporus]KAI5186097.1 hypothetical protein NEHOM01_1279 [Nematocida homosporus]
MDIYRYITIVTVGLLSWLGLGKHTTSAQDSNDPYQSCAHVNNNTLLFDREIRSLDAIDCDNRLRNGTKTSIQDVKTSQQEEWMESFRTPNPNTNDTKPWTSLYQNCPQTSYPNNSTCKYDIELRSMMDGFSTVTQNIQRLRPLIRELINKIDKTLESDTAESLYASLSDEDVKTTIGWMESELNEADPNLLHSLIMPPRQPSESIEQLWPVARESTIQTWKDHILDASSSTPVDISSSNQCTYRQLYHYLHAFIRTQTAVTDLLRFQTSPMGLYYELNVTGNTMAVPLDEFTKLNVIQLFKTKTSKDIIKELSKYTKSQFDDIYTNSTRKADHKLLTIKSTLESLKDGKYYKDKTSDSDSLRVFFNAIESHLTNITTSLEHTTFMSNNDTLTTNWPSATNLRQCVMALETMQIPQPNPPNPPPAQNGATGSTKDATKKMDDNDDSNKTDGKDATKKMDDNDDSNKTDGKDATKKMDDNDDSNKTGGKDPNPPNPPPAPTNNNTSPPSTTLSPIPPTTQANPTPPTTQANPISPTTQANPTPFTKKPSNPMINTPPPNDHKLTPKPIQNHAQSIFSPIQVVYSLLAAASLSIVSIWSH